MQGDFSRLAVFKIIISPSAPTHFIFGTGKNTDNTFRPTKNRVRRCCVGVNMADWKPWGSPSRCSGSHKVFLFGRSLRNSLSLLQFRNVSFWKAKIPNFGGRNQTIPFERKSRSNSCSIYSLCLTFWVLHWLVLDE